MEQMDNMWKEVKRNPNLWMEILKVQIENKKLPNPYKVINLGNRAHIWINEPKTWANIINNIVILNEVIEMRNLLLEFFTSYPNKEDRAVRMARKGFEIYGGWLELLGYDLRNKENEKISSGTIIGEYRNRYQKIMDKEADDKKLFGRVITKSRLVNGR